MDDLRRIEIDRRLKNLAVVQARQENELKELADKLEQLHQMSDVQVTMPSALDKWIYRILPESTRQDFKRNKLARDIDYLKKSPLFDPLWYLAEYPDVLESGIDAAAHYVLHGEPEGRRPTATFNVDVRRVIKYRELPSTGCYFVRYLELLQKQPGFLDVSEIKRNLPETHSGNTAPGDLDDLFGPSTASFNAGGDKIEVLFIGHDASFTGAPFALLELIERLTQAYPIKARIVLQHDGPLVEKYRELGPVALLPMLKERTGSVDKAARLLSSHFAALPGPKLVFANTADIDPAFCLNFKKRKIPYLNWIHEMPDDIERLFGGQRKMATLAENSASLIFISAFSRKENVARFKLREDNVCNIGWGVQVQGEALDRAAIRRSIRLQLGIPEDARIVLGCGTVQARKGPDLFVQAAKLFLDSKPDSNTYFLWVGRVIFPEYLEDLEADIQRAQLQDRVRFLGAQKSTQPFFQASDAFLFTSRSETFGTVAIEAIGHHLPVIGFANATGAAKYITSDFGSLVPYLNIHAMAQELDSYLTRQKTIAKDGQAYVRRELDSALFAGEFYREFRRVIDRKKPDSNKKILVIAAGCPPLCGHRAEGGGLRSWGLARSLKQLLPDHEVTLAYHYKLEDKIAEGLYEDVFVKEWAAENLIEMTGEFSTVVMSYSMGVHSRHIAAHLGPHQQLILDCYVPIYVEVCARKSDSIEQEYNNLLSDIPGFNETLKRGDFFLCANTAQVDFYRGILSALGRINPKTYHDPGLRIVPYGIDSNEPAVKSHPIKNLLGNAGEKSWKILWFGAVYPWFNIKVLIDAIGLLNQKHPTRMVMVGAKNPFNAHPDFVEKSAQVQSLVSQPDFKELIHTHDWVPFEERGDWYLDCDLIITLNEPGMENGLSWRTRVADYVWAGMPVASNGGDPLTEDLIANGAAGRLDISSAESLSESIYKILSDEPRLKSMKAQMQLYRPKLYWENVIKPLGEVIECHNLAADRIS